MSVAERTRRNPRKVDTRRSPKLTKSDVVGLSMEDVRCLDRDGLLDVIHTVDVPLLREQAAEHLSHADDATLRQLAFLAQRTARHQGY